MSVVRRAVSFVLLLLFSNCIFAFYALDWPVALRVLAVVALAVFFVLYWIFPRGAADAPSHKMKRLIYGRETALMSLALLVAEILLLLYELLVKSSGRLFVDIANPVLGFLVVGLLMFGGVLRMITSGGQLGATRRALLWFLWWVPVYGQVLLVQCCRTAQREYRFAILRAARNAARAAQQICRTKYPVLMVHGIFFRDGKLLNYWGRIPEELEQNGASLYYGNQQSSASARESAEELKRRVLEIAGQTGCEKVNIIAHSKGGLDSRYAISKLGMAPYVASLTTVNTPHRGCRFANNALRVAPDGVVSAVDKGYDAIFRALGDDSPNFLAGVGELTDTACARFNEEAPDAPGVFYQSIGSRMSTARSAPFPLSMTHRAIQPLEGDNDGLVAVHSMKWGPFIDLTGVTGDVGVSHGDMIDLMRRDIPGFDVREFYVGVLSGLRERGF